MGSAPGDTAILVAIPGADDVIGSWRATSAEDGLPPHVTLLYPFVPLMDITAKDRRALAQIVGEFRQAEVRFEACGRFPSVVYLEPETPSFFSDISACLAARWSAFPPYGGAFETVIPHLTIAEGLSIEEQDYIEAATTQSLPFAALVSEVWLMVFDGERWQTELSVPLAPR